MKPLRNAWKSGLTGLLVLCCVVGCATFSPKPSLSVDAQAEALSHFSIALLAGGAGDSAIALRELETAIQIDPNETTLYPPAITLALKMDQPEKALHLARQLKKTNPDDLNTLLLFAQITAITGQDEKAEALFRKTVSAFPNEPSSHRYLARFFVSQNRLPEAVRTLESAVEKNADEPDLLILLAQLYIEKEKDRKPSELQKEPSALLKGIHLLEGALETDASNPALWEQLGHLHIALRQFDKARHALEKVRAERPADILLAKQVLNLFILSESFDRAIELLDDLPTQTGTQPELWVQYLIESFPPEQNGRLIQYLEEQLQQDHPSSFYYAHLSSLYLTGTQYAKMESTLKMGLADYPKDHQLLMLFGVLCFHQEEYQDAYAAFDRVRTTEPDPEWVESPFFVLNFITAAQKTGHLDEAVSAIASAYTNDPLVLIQYMRLLSKNPPPVSRRAAIDLLNAFHTLNPKALEALYCLMTLHTMEKEYEVALETAQRVEVLAQSQSRTNLIDGSFYYQYGSLHERVGRRTEAEQLFFKTIEMGNPDIKAAAQNYLAYMWAEHGEKLELALELVQKALSSDPNNAAFIDTLGWVYYMQGRYEEALDRLKAASELIQNDPAIWDHLGYTYLQLGDPSAARKHWQKALDLNPADQKRLQEQINSVDHPAEADDPEDTPPRP